MKTSIVHKGANVLSFLLHPFMIPTYATIMFLFGSAAFMFLPQQARQAMTVNILVNTLVLPALLIYLCYRLKLLKDLDIDDRKSRRIPMVIAAVCYVIAMMMIPDAMLIFVVRKFVLVALLALVLVFIINLKWKISLHLTAMGGFTAMVFILNVSNLIYTPIFLICVILLVGLLGSARLLLGKHTPAQVGAGFLCGFTVCVVTMLFL